MAFITSGFSGGDEEDGILAEINITPLVDVMLVLLIIFMITAPMLHQGIEVALPKSDSPNLPLRKEDPVILSVNREGMIYLKERPVHPTKLVEVLTPMLRGRDDETVFLKGDRDVPYGRIVEVLDTLHKGGISKVGMVTEKPEAAKK
jgi:biopolymer transport protein TolR